LLCFAFLFFLISFPFSSFSLSQADSPAALAENAIKALSNLLSANIQAGLEYFVTMGYHDDHDTRSAFLKVISNILAQVYIPSSFTFLGHFPLLSPKHPKHPLKVAQARTNRSYYGHAF
jgi:hypothetical protein